MRLRICKQQSPQSSVIGLVRSGESVASGVLEILSVERKQVAQNVFPKIGLDQSQAEQRAVVVAFLDAQRTSSTMNIQPQRNLITWLLAAALGVALVYITRLQRALQAARQRGDTYRDLVGRLDRKDKNQS
jgi:hypothetical protein